MQERNQDIPDGHRVFVHDEEFISWKDVCKITSLGYRTLLELYKNGLFVKPLASFPRTFFPRKAVLEWNKCEIVRRHPELFYPYLKDLAHKRAP
jgi:predicted DNA-binding transcriptional regulator AlpA